MLFSTPSYVRAITTDPEYDKIFVGKNNFLAGGGAEWLREGMTKQAVENARLSIDAASLVFAHSILDDAAWSYCEVTALARPQDWERHVEQRKLDLKQAKEQKYEDLLKQAVDRRLQQLRNDSLLQKIDLLHEICKPPHGFAPLQNYKYDRDRIRRIDEERNEIVHRDGLAGTRIAVDEDLEYVGKTVNYLLALVHEHYGIKLDPVHVFDLQWARDAVRSS